MKSLTCLSATLVKERGKEALGSLRLLLLISALLRSDARTIDGAVCARLNTSCENSKQLSVQISAAHPLKSACAFLFTFTVSEQSLCQTVDLSNATFH